MTPYKEQRDAAANKHATYQGEHGSTLCVASRDDFKSGWDQAMALASKEIARLEKRYLELRDGHEHVVHKMSAEIEQLKAKYESRTPAKHKELIEANKALVEALEDGKSQLDWYANTFAGWEDRPHEFEHFWRVELPFQIDQALAKAKEIKGE